MSCYWVSSSGQLNQNPHKWGTSTTFVSQPLQIIITDNCRESLTSKSGDQEPTGLHSVWEEPLCQGVTVT